MKFFIHKTNVKKDHFIELKNEWSIFTIGDIEKEIHMFSGDPTHKKVTTKLIIDFTEISTLDNYGIIGILRLLECFAVRFDDKKVCWENVKEKHDPLLQSVFLHAYTKPSHVAKKNSFKQYLEPLYRLYVDLWFIMSFCGLVCINFFKMFTKKHHIPFAATLRQIEDIGARSMVIVCVVGSLIGMILTQQMIYQLSRYGGQDFVVNGVAIIILRDLGVFMVGITLAGRTVSAFTSEIGLMKTQQEIDAMRVLNIEPMISLVIPRIVALMFVMPMLTMIINIVALSMAGVVCYIMLDFSFSFFYDLLKEAVKLELFIVGMIKAPFMGFWMAIIGCVQGLRVESKVTSLGRNTTQAVVKSIIAILIINAIFSLFFSVFKI